MRHSLIQQNLSRTNRPRPDYLPFKGGYDEKTPSYEAPPGRLRQALNWQVAVGGGYETIKGYERYDGQASPSSAIYYVMNVTITGALAAGQTVTGASSSDTGVIIAIADDSSYIVLTKVTGTFTDGEDLEVSATKQAEADSVAQADAAPTTILDAQYKNLAADEYRSDIGAVTGSGNILGLAFLNDVTYAFRANAGATAVNIYKSTTSGWTQVTLGRELSFTSGGTYEVQEGDTITGATSGATATVERVVLDSGTWAGGDAAGRLILSGQTGAYQAENLDVGGSLNVATIAGNSTAISLSVGGRFEFITYDFGVERRLYGCDGVNRGFEFDGEVLVPIETGMTVDTPDHVWAHKNHLFFAFGPSLQHSSIKEPYSWNPVTGAAELRIGDNINAFSTEGGTETSGALAIYSNNSIHVLYGTSSSDWSLEKYKGEVGGKSYSVLQMNQSYFIDDRGITSLYAVQNFGNFSHSTISELVKDTISAKKGLISDSCMVRDLNQLRWFFSDKTALYATFENRSLLGIMPVTLSHQVTCMYSAEKNDGSETIKFGSTDGYVYEMEKGTSFDGSEINTSMTTFFHYSGSPRVEKNYMDCTLEVQGDGYAELTFGFELGYGDTSVPQPASQNSIVSFSAARWDSFTWDSFVWDGQSLLPSILEMDGDGENVSLAITTSSDYFSQIKISGAYFHYRLRNRLRYSK